MRILGKEEFVERIMRDTKENLSNEVKEIIEENSNYSQEFLDASIEGIQQKDTTDRIIKSLKIKK